MTACVLALLLLASAPSGLAAAPAGPAAAPSGEGRDPFAAPGAEMSDPKLGLKGMVWQDLRCTSVVSGPRIVAVLQSKAGDSFLVREGDVLRNAVIVKIDKERRGVLMREPVPGTVAGFREIVLRLGREEAIVREPTSVDPSLPAQGTR